MCSSSNKFNIGSSPRLWGTVFTAQIADDDIWFIPTPVGNGFQLETGSVATSVHPHACGERRRYYENGSHAGGSSPRLWGTVYANVFRGEFQRFIPTPVGNGRTAMFKSDDAAVHPHACGERLPER